jgi:CDP-paratose synthetase
VDENQNKGKEMSKVLLLGYRGFIGSAVLELLVRKNHYEIVVLGSPTDKYENLPLDIGRLTADDIYNGNLAQMRIDTVINCANSYETTSLMNNSPQIVNLQLPLAILESVLGSATHFVNLDTSLNKVSAPHFYSARVMYSLSKKHFKEYLELMSDQIQVSNLICEHVYGYASMHRNTIVAELVSGGLSGKHRNLMLTPGEQIRDFVFVEDVATAVLNVIEQRLFSFNQNLVDFEVGSGHGTSIAQLATLVQEKLKLGDPFQLGRISYRENEIMSSTADITLMKKLGWLPSITLSEGLDRVIQYARSCETIRSQD